MTFIDKIKAATSALQDMQRLSVRALGRQLDLASDELDEIVEELVDVQQVARLDGKALVWLSAPPHETPTPRPSPGAYIPARPARRPRDAPVSAPRAENWPTVRVEE